MAKTNCSVVTYTAIFGSVEAPEETDAPNTDGADSAASMDLSAMKRPLAIAGVTAVLAVGGVILFKKFKERRR